jgi:hypothetical protein
MCRRDVDGSAVVCLGLARGNTYRPWMREVKGWMRVESQAGDKGFAGF